MINDQQSLGTGDYSLLDAAMTVCFLGDISLAEISDDTLGRSLTHIVDNPNLFRWARAYSRVCSAHTRDLVELDLTPQAPSDELAELQAALHERQNGSLDWRHLLQSLIDKGQHAGIRVLAEEALHLSHPVR